MFKQNQVLDEKLDLILGGLNELTGLYLNDKTEEQECLKRGTISHCRATRFSGLRDYENYLGFFSDYASSWSKKTINSGVSGVNQHVAPILNPLDIADIGNKNRQSLWGKKLSELRFFEGNYSTLLRNIFKTEALTVGNPHMFVEGLMIYHRMYNFIKDKKMKNFSLEDKKEFNDFYQQNLSDLKIFGSNMEKQIESIRGLEPAPYVSYIQGYEETLNQIEKEIERARLGVKRNFFRERNKQWSTFIQNLRDRDFRDNLIELKNLYNGFLKPNGDPRLYMSVGFPEPKPIEDRVYNFDSEAYSYLKELQDSENVDVKDLLYAANAGKHKMFIQLKGDPVSPSATWNYQTEEPSIFIRPSSINIPELSISFYIFAALERLHQGKLIGRYSITEGMNPQPFGIYDNRVMKHNFENQVKMDLELYWVDNFEAEESKWNKHKIFSVTLKPNCSNTYCGFTYSRGPRPGGITINKNGYDAWKGLHMIAYNWFGEFYDTAAKSNIVVETENLKRLEKLLEQLRTNFFEEERREVMNVISYENKNELLKKLDGYYVLIKAYSYFVLNQSYLHNEDFQKKLNALKISDDIFENFKNIESKPSPLGYRKVDIQQKKIASYLSDLKLKLKELDNSMASILKNSRLKPETEVYRFLKEACDKYLCEEKEQAFSGNEKSLSMKELVDLDNSDEVKKDKYGFEVIEKSNFKHKNIKSGMSLIGHCTNENCRKEDVSTLVQLNSDEEFLVKNDRVLTKDCENCGRPLKTEQFALTSTFYSKGNAKDLEEVHNGSITLIKNSDLKKYKTLACAVIRPGKAKEGLTLVGKCDNKNCSLKGDWKMYPQGAGKFWLVDDGANMKAKCSKCSESVTSQGYILSDCQCVIGKDKSMLVEDDEFYFAKDQDEFKYRSCTVDSVLPGLNIIGICDNKECARFNDEHNFPQGMGYFPLVKDKKMMEIKCPRCTGNVRLKKAFFRDCLYNKGIQETKVAKRYDSKDEYPIEGESYINLTCEAKPDPNN